MFDDALRTRNCTLALLFAFQLVKDNDQLVMFKTELGHDEDAEGKGGVQEYSMFDH
jgi:hypothetical protein